MSDVIENTFSSLSRLLNENLISSISGSPPTGVKTHGASKGFENFIRSVSCARNKHEEDGVIQKELSVLRQRLSQPNVSTSQMKDFMVRVIYCGMLGHDVNFASIHAVKLAQHGKLQEKRIGYLSASLLLHEDHELVLLLINTIQKDLSSSNMLENCMGLMAICQLVNAEMAPMLLPAVIEKLKHPRSVVRKKAVMCLQKFQLKSPGSVQHLTDHFRGALCDKDPGVMATSLHIYLQLIQECPDKHLGLVPGFVSTLQQVITRKLPSDYEYHSIPAPWVQVKLLKILAALGKGQQRASSLMYEVLKETLERATVKDNAAFAILYECVVTITTIWPESSLLHTAASYVGKFLRSKGNNLRYAGLQALGHLVRSGSEFVTDYQMIVVECLEDPDQSIQRKTYDLLYQMTNTSNVDVICKRLMTYLSGTRDQFVRAELVSKITQLIITRQWYISNMNQLIEVSRDQTPSQVSKSLLNIIRTGCSEAEASYQTQREFVVETYQGYLHRPDPPPQLLSVTAWVMGEYSHSVPGVDVPAVCDCLVKHYESSSTEDPSRHYILSCLQKMFLNGSVSVTKLLDVMKSLENSTKGHNLKQRILELKMLAMFETKLLESLKTTSDCNGKKMDFTLSFLDDYVSEALEGGSTAYKPRQIRFLENKKVTDVKSILDEIHYERYSSSVGSQGTGNSAERGDGRPLDGSTDSVYSGSGKVEARPPGLNLSGVKRVWGRGGVAQTDSSPSTSTQDTDPYPDSRAAGANPPEQQQQQYDSSGHNTDEEEARRKKEDLAAALFSGLGGGPSSASSPHPQPSGSDVISERLSSLSISQMPSSETRHKGQPKFEEVSLAKQKPADGHDWRKFQKPDEMFKPDVAQADALAIPANVETLLEESVADDSWRPEPVQPPEVEIFETNPSSGEFSTDNAPARESQSSMYDLLRSELTEEDLLLVTNSDLSQQQQQQQIPKSQDPS